MNLKRVSVGKHRWKFQTCLSQVLFASIIRRYVSLLFQVQIQDKSTTSWNPINERLTRIQTVTIIALTYATSLDLGNKRLLMSLSWIKIKKKCWSNCSFKNLRKVKTKNPPSLKVLKRQLRKNRKSFSSVWPKRFNTKCWSSYLTWKTLMTIMRLGWENLKLNEQWGVKRFKSSIKNWSINAYLCLLLDLEKFQWRTILIISEQWTTTTSLLM